MEKQTCEKKVSIIVPVYNAEGYLERCLGSLLRQTYENTEILLIDDGSTDRSGKICDEYAGQYPVIRSIHMENAGVSAARNKGIELSEGEYLTFVDADDYAAADMVAHLTGILEHSGSDVAGCGYYTFEASQTGMEALGDSRSDGQADVEILTGIGFMEHGILNSDTRCWSKLYRKESIGTLRFQTGLTIGEDMLFLLELARAGRQFCRSRYKAYGYYVNASGAMQAQFKDSYMDQITCWQRALEVIEKEVPRLTVQAETVLLVSVMLVVGKLSMLSAGERREKETAVRYCLSLVREYAKKKAVYTRLDTGYRIKVSLYGTLPELYMRLYHLKGEKAYGKG